MTFNLPRYNIPSIYVPEKYEKRGCQRKKFRKNILKVPFCNFPSLTSGVDFPTFLGIYSFCAFKIIKTAFDMVSFEHTYFLFDSNF